MLHVVRWNYSCTQLWGTPSHDWRLPPLCFNFSLPILFRLTYLAGRDPLSKLSWDPNGVAFRLG